MQGNRPCPNSSLPNLLSVLYLPLKHQPADTTLSNSCLCCCCCCRRRRFSSVPSCFSNCPPRHMKQPYCSAMSFPMPASLTLAATASIFAALLLRRRMRVRAALSEWSRVAAAHGLSNAPPHHVRVAITGERPFHSCQSYVIKSIPCVAGASRGIGRACVDLLSKRVSPSCTQLLFLICPSPHPRGRYSCIDVVVMGRVDSTVSAPCSHSIAVDLADSKQVASAASTLAGKWYSDSNATSSPPPLGLDIVINNAGVFSGHNSGKMSYCESF